MSSIPAELLSEVPSSLHTIVENYWQDWCASCEAKSVDISVALPLTMMGRTMACSDFVARNCIRYPDIFYKLYAEGFELSRTLDDYRQLVGQLVIDARKNSGDDDKLMSVLRVLRQQEMLRIAWRDLNGLANDETVLHELTDLAEAVVSIILQYLEQQQAETYGMPLDADGEEQSLLVFAMGKMGGRELNFSSDIDLIFAFAEDGETTGRRRTSHYEFYLAVIRKLVKILDAVTADGFVYRVDTRLRPFGESGPMAMSFNGFEQYYQLQGRDWERYAMIKAKLISGRASDKHYLQTMLTPFVYRRYLDFSMLESIREMKAMISAQMKRKRMVNNIKLGRGGIREIEFIGQTLQLIRAGREPELRTRGIIKVLTLLAEKNYLHSQEVEQLIAAYWFLRKLENRLQMQNDKQTHTLPDDEIARQRLCLAMKMESWDVLLAQLAMHQNAVDGVFQHLVASESEEQQPMASPFHLFWDEIEQSKDVAGELKQYLVSSAYAAADADDILLQLAQLRRSPQVKQLTPDNNNRLVHLLIALLEQLVHFPQPVVLFDRVSRIIKSLAGRKVYISLLNEYPPVQQKMLKLCASSEWFTRHLIEHPILLDGLLGSIEVFRQQYDIRHLLALELQQISNYSDQDGVEIEQDLEQQMDRMRQFKRQTVFNVAVLDVFYEEPVEAVSDRLTELANVLLEKILELSWQAMAAKYGAPTCVVKGEVMHPTMSIVAYGKMGGNELGYGSDLDIIFLHNSRGEKQYTAGEKSIANQHFFARVAQRIIHFLNTRTYSGMLYEADTRLRPDGQAGLMVSSIAAFEAYQREKAWTWEHQALIRARFVTGNVLLEQEFDRIRGSILQQPRDAVALVREVVTMREKMRKHLASKSADFDIKQDAGGLVDIEFMTQAGVLIYAEQHESCLRHTATLALISELTHVGWYDHAQAEKLSNAYRYFRKLKNWQNLQCEADVSEVSQHRENVIAVWGRLMPEVVVEVGKD